jgi:cell wall-associated NlpC family hydrolase/SH3-like domain-containing protein
MKNFLKKTIDKIISLSYNGFNKSVTILKEIKKAGEKLIMSFKKSILCATTAIFSSAVFTVCAFAANSAVISGDGVNVRLAPNMTSEVIKQYNNGQSIDIISMDGDFYRVSEAASPNGVAYVAQDLVIIMQIDAKIIESDVNIRKAASTDSEVIGKLQQGDKISVTGREGTFFAFNYGGGIGYIHSDFIEGDFINLAQQQESAPVTSISSAYASTDMWAQVESENGINFRASASTNGEVIFALPYTEIVDLLSPVPTAEGWYSAMYAGVQGFVKAEFVSVHSGQKPDRSARTILANAIISFAKKYLGTPYSWGGTNLNYGVDCSGFTYSVFKNFGYYLNRSSRDQLYSGTPIYSRENLLPGDLVFFGNGSISHVGIYMGGGQFIHAASGSEYRVTTNYLSDSWYNSRFIAGTRIF